jgi:hypothetical protein
MPVAVQPGENPVESKRNSCQIGNQGSTQLNGPDANTQTQGNAKPTPKSPNPRAFLNQLHSDVTRLEFAHYDSNGDGKIKGVDFANSIAAAADVRSVDKYLDRVGFFYVFWGFCMRPEGWMLGFGWGGLWRVVAIASRSRSCFLGPAAANARASRRRHPTAAVISNQAPRAGRRPAPPARPAPFPRTTGWPPPLSRPIQVDAMDPKLREAPISFADFSTLAHVRRHLHRLTFALEFSHRIGRHVERADLVGGGRGWAPASQPSGAAGSCLCPSNGPGSTT